VEILFCCHPELVEGAVKKIETKSLTRRGTPNSFTGSECQVPLKG